MTHKKLAGQVAIVTGASRGIGRVVALRLAQEGASVAVCSRSLDAVNKVAQEVEALGCPALACQADVAESEQVKALVAEALKRFGRIDILVNNAGITADQLILRMKDSEWDRVISTNLKGAFNCIREVARTLIKHRAGGKIINITSVVGIRGNAGQANYASSKAGLIGLTKAAAKEFASRRVCVNAIAPGFIDTAMTRQMSPAQQDALINQIPLGRLGQPEEVAEAVIYLVSPAADYITGQVLCIDGGMTI